MKNYGKSLHELSSGSLLTGSSLTEQWMVVFSVRRYRVLRGDSTVFSMPALQVDMGSALGTWSSKFLQE